MRGIAEKLPLITHWSQINAAERVKTALETEIGVVFDRPTPLIQNGLRIISDRPSLAVRLGWKDIFGKNEPTVEHRGQLYADAVSRTLIPQIDGGVRPPKPSERTLRAAGLLRSSEWLVPSRTAPVDAYGNIPGSVMAKIIADLGGFTRSGTSANTGGAKRQYILGKVGTTRGIFRIEGGADNLARGRWSLVFLITTRAPVYRPRFKFYETAQKTFAAVYPGEFDRVFDRELARL